MFSNHAGLTDPQRTLVMFIEKEITWRWCAASRRLWATEQARQDALSGRGSAGAGEPRLPGYMDIYLSPHQHKKQQLREDP